MKIIGLIFISIIPILIALNYRNRLKEKRDTLVELVSLLKSVKQAVRHTRSPINEILDKINNPLIVGDNTNAKENLYTNLLSHKSELEIVKNCFNKIEGLDILSADEELDLCIEQLTESESEAIKAYKEKSDFYVKLGALGSAFVLIILI